MAWEELFSIDTPDSYQPKLFNTPALIEELEQIARRAEVSPKWEKHVRKIQEEISKACKLEHTFLSELPRYQWQLGELARKQNISDIVGLCKILRPYTKGYEGHAIEVFLEAVKGLPKAKTAVFDALHRLATIALRKGRTIEDFRGLFSPSNFNRSPEEVAADIVVATEPRDRQFVCIVAVKGQLNDLQVVGRKSGFNPNQNMNHVRTNSIRDAITLTHKAGAFSRLARLQRAALTMLLCALPMAVRAVEPPKVGDKAPDFALKTLDDQTVRLSELTAKGPVVLVVLRGWPGYQCPICDRQAHDFIASASGFADAKAQLVFVYPGPADDLKAHAQEFKDWKGKQWPKEFLYVLDPDYTMVNAYNLRWDAPQETAYPSTFVLDGTGTVRYAKISHNHGGRAAAKEILAEVKKLN